MLIGYSGYAQVGKDCAAQPLIEAGFHRIAFADELKNRVAQMLDVETDYVEENKSTLRPLLVELGRAGRWVDPDFWVDIALRCADLYENVVVTDVRYANEAHKIRQLGGIVVTVIRPGVLAANHEEYTSMTEFTYDKVLVNSGTINEMHEKVKARFL